jgi:hypothetical protein
LSAKQDVSDPGYATGVIVLFARNDTGRNFDLWNAPPFTVDQEDPSWRAAAFIGLRA